MCKLTCPWLNPYLFVSFGGWFVTSRKWPVFADLRKYDWEPEGTHLTDDVSSCCVSPGIFDRALSQPALSDMGILVVAGVRFDVSGQALSPKGDSVPAGSRLMVSVDTSVGDRFPVTTAARSLTGGSECCGWLQFVMRGVGAVSPPISMRERTTVHSQGSGVTCIWIVYTRQGSVEVLPVTGSLLLQIILCCLVVVYFQESRRVVKNRCLVRCADLCILWRVDGVQ